MAITVEPTNSVTISVPEMSSRDSRRLVRVRTATFEAGVHIDGNRMPVEQGTIELVRFTNRLLDQLGVAQEIVEPVVDDDNENNMDDFAAASDECEEALNRITPNGWHWRWEDSDFWLNPPDQRVGFEVERVEADAIVVADGVGGFYPEAVEGFWKIEVYTADEDGDLLTEQLGTFAATWAGGQAFYVNLYGRFHESGVDAWPALNTTAYTITNPVEALGLGDERSRQAAQARLVDWLQHYADRTDDADWFHDAPHYGLPS